MNTKYLASNEMLTNAIELATVAHRGQTTRDGKAYILHPLHVMMAVDGLEEKIVAVLHDVVEDTSVDLEHLRHVTNDLTASAVDLVTRRQGEPYDDFISRIINSTHKEARLLAIKVKMADLVHNMDMSRLPNITEKDRERRKKYWAAEQRLHEALL